MSMMNALSNACCVHLRPDPNYGRKGHIIAIYGFNVSILVAVFLAASRPLLGQRRSVMLAIIGVILYTLLVGAGASVVRAAIMSSLALIGQRLEGCGWMPPARPRCCWPTAVRARPPARTGSRRSTRGWR
jgi:hypothetical protein